MRIGVSTVLRVLAWVSSGNLEVLALSPTLAGLGTWLAAGTATAWMWARKSTSVTMKRTKTPTFSADVPSSRSDSPEQYPGV